MAGYGLFLIISEILDARRRGATTEAYGAIRLKGERALARLWREGNPPEADERRPSTLLRTVSLWNGR